MDALTQPIGLEGLYAVLGKFGYFQNKGRPISVWNFVLNFGLGQEISPRQVDCQTITTIVNRT